MLKTRDLMLVFILTFILISIGFIAAESEYHDSIPVTTDSGGSIVIDPNNCQEDWSGSTWGQCLDDQQTFICFDKNTCGTYDLEPTLCGELRECGEEEETTTTTTNSNPGGGSPGDSNIFLLDNDETQNAACTENWVCGEWSNSDQSCGKRTCEEVNNCGTTLLKPKTSESCSSTSFSWITAAVTGFTDFAKSSPVSLIFIILIIAGIVLIFILKKSKKESGNIKRN